jgi:hypothetical protein
LCRTCSSPLYDNQPGMNIKLFATNDNTSRSVVDADMKQLAVLDVEVPDEYGSNTYGFTVRLMFACSERDGPPIAAELAMMAVDNQTGMELRPQPCCKQRCSEMNWAMLSCSPGSPVRSGLFAAAFVLVRCRGSSRMHQ